MADEGELEAVLLAGRFICSVTHLVLELGAQCLQISKLLEQLVYYPPTGCRISLLLHRLAVICIVWEPSRLLLKASRVLFEDSHTQARFDKGGNFGEFAGIPKNYKP